ncbi:hypothetical protein D3870_08740 [Noviherbaspirillum cavernae]|uniref:AP2 domain-containing protein n=1 Tax=Noviherbaspirillum cavernae TaxID=2320862 RepID=A0A418X0Y3_9BURK|nr:hypothetical protein [Noviherbaspirillum cavernae]RJG06082.1 hypothetical protein D3870_08740 [Noviherbaspirillum cavernae]
MERKKRNKQANALTWQRGYRCHTLWNGTQRIGRISLGESGKWDGVYRCEVGTLRGETASLPEAKRWLKEQARLDLTQLRLF